MKFSETGAERTRCTKTKQARQNQRNWLQLLVTRGTSCSWFCVVFWLVISRIPYVLSTNMYGTVYITHTLNQDCLNTFFGLFLTKIGY